MTDLTLVLEDDLWEEMKKRYEGFIFVTLNTLDKSRESIKINYHGGKSICIGLAELCKKRIIEDFLGECK